jgi:hypothetical protein
LTLHSPPWKLKVPDKEVLALEITNVIEQNVRVHHCSGRRSPVCRDEWACNGKCGHEQEPAYACIPCARILEKEAKKAERPEKRQVKLKKIAKATAVSNGRSSRELAEIFVCDFETALSA